MVNELVLRTPRLTIFPFSANQLSLALQDVRLLSEDMALPIVPELVTPPVRRAMTMKLGKMAGAPCANHAWYTYWLIVVQQDGERMGAGMAGFKGAPDEHGSVEIGYGIDPAFRRKGYMTEAVPAMIDWAFQQEACREVTACGVLKTNPASSHVLRKVWMTQSGEDEESYSYRVLREEWRSRQG